MNVTDKKTQRWPGAIDHSSIQKTTSDPKTSPNQRQMCRNAINSQAVTRPTSVPKTRTCTEHHVCSMARQDTHREEVFKDLNFSLFESKELVNNPTK